MARKKISMDGNTAAAHVSYAFTEVAGIYPITPSSVMAELTDAWSATGLKNIFGDTVKVIEMQSEAGAAGTVHGSLSAGALTTTFTASQGLLLMIPNMFKIAGELLPSVIHVSARTVASHALNIFGDHSDVYACRQTGYAMLANTNPQEVMDLGAVAHLSTIKGRVPVLNFFDGFRTSHEIQKIEAWDYKDLDELVDKDAIAAFRNRALNPEHPILKGSAENGDIFFQHREACNRYYDEFPAIVEDYMNKINEKIGADYKLFNYYGAPGADRVIIAMGSICDVAEEVIDYLTAKGEKVGLVKVRLYRPFVAEKLIEAIPATAKKIAVLDRTKEPGALGEPLYLDVVTSLAQHGFAGKIVGGRYGLGSKDTPPASVFAVYKNLEAAQPKNGFTLGIVDDVTGHSLDESFAPDTAAPGTISCKFWGLGGDGTVGANKNSIKIIGDHTDKYIQAYFQYDSKKTGGITISHLRFGDKPIKSPYYITKASFVACHNPSYMLSGFRIVEDVAKGGTFLLSCQWSAAELEDKLPASVKKYIAKNDIKFYIVNAIDVARGIGMGKRTNTILQSAFFALANILPINEAIDYMKYAAKKSYLKKGEAVVEMNYKAIDAGVDAIVKIDVPEAWKTIGEELVDHKITGDRPEIVKFVKSVVVPTTRMLGDTLPVSAFVDYVDGAFPQGAAAYEKRGVAVEVPEWIPENCIQCTQCSYVCPHATIRPFMMNTDEQAKAPEQTKKAAARGKNLEGMAYSISISPLDCMGCGLCAIVCPAKNKALVMKPQESQCGEQEVFDYMVADVSKKETGFAENTIKGSQFNQPLLEFSGSCAGCAETSYARLITQLFGERMYISNATGCSSIWGGSAPATPYTVNRDSLRGPAWANSLFEDNAEHGLGIYLGQKTLRDRLIGYVTELSAKYAGMEGTAEMKAILDKYLETKNNGKENEKATKILVEMLEKNVCNDKCDCCDLEKKILDNKSYLSKKSIWIFGGDGWAYDIGFGGLDHVVASGEDVNIFVFDTEVYSNTGGQASKASQLGQVAQFAAAGKAIGKKDLAQIAMTYGYVYVAQVAMGADMNQTLKAILEAEAYPGPSIVIGYAPCEMHGVKGGMTNCQIEMKRAVEAGYWANFRYNPMLKADGKNPFILDSKEPTGDYVDFIKSETRYSRLIQTFPDRAEVLFEKAQENAKAKYLKLKEMANK
ncbi:MAG: pyruvate:ferredoxin (flavodoxin) oxidoreductase [Clostridiales bacterium GWF2_38_85]|nr:MAG: pyruvate:ferredoxin (flavodoxin) oxidoreductase [Clostridiales bacterium GWF2_38_85]HBL83616.1 pyruvate:ferredoxin (flavodoxin) oxidoreductase [Clostridiales bacterium]